MALNPVNLDVFKQKPTPRFLLGIGVVGFSYLIGWPLITLFGILALYFGNPWIFAIGSPAAYGVSHLVFLLGIVIAGRDTIMYMNTFALWCGRAFLKKILGQALIPYLNDHNVTDSERV